MKQKEDDHGDFLQECLSESFGGGEDRIWGTGENLPEMHGALRSGHGLIKCDDPIHETLEFFGIKLFRHY